MVHVIVLISFLLLIFSQYPFVVSKILVLVISWFQLEWNFIIFLDFIEIETSWTFPIIPTTAYWHLLRSGDLFCLKAETVRLTLEPWCIFQNLSKLFNIVPLWFPILALRICKHKWLFMLLGWIIIRHFKLLNLVFNPKPIDINFILHSVEFIIPPTSYILFFDNWLSCIFSKFLISCSIFVNIQSPSHAALEIFKIVWHEVEPISFQHHWIKLKYSILKATGSESNDRCTRTEKFMLDDTSGLKHRRHHGVVTSDVN